MQTSVGNQIKLVIWDWNGTLVNDGPLAHSIFNDLLVARDAPTVSYEQYRLIYRHPVHHMYEEAGIDLERWDFQTISEEWHARFSDSIAQASLHHDTRPTLGCLHARGFKQVILSALPHKLLELSIELHGIRNFFSNIQGQPNNLGSGKIDTGHALMQELKADPSTTILIGDSSHDAETAQALNVRCFLVPRGNEHPTKLETLGVPIFSDFAALMSHLGL